MKRFILSTFSVLIATSAISLGAGFTNTPAAQALTKIDPAFNLQTLRLSEFDARNKAEEEPQPYYPQTSTPASPQTVTTEQNSTPTTKPTEWNEPEAQEEETSPALSIIEQRRQVLDRS